MLEHSMRKRSLAAEESLCGAELLDGRTMKIILNYSEPNVTGIIAPGNFLGLCIPTM